MSAPSPFDITGPLPTGTTLLEASAGTGKTWTIGALVTRYVAEGVVTLPELLVITFGRAASREMRERVRDHLVAAEAALADPDTAPDGDPVVRSLVSVDDEERTRRLARVRTALTDFDGATIATTHQFCQAVLRSLGTAGDTDRDAELSDDLRDVVAQIVDDLYVARYAAHDDPALTHDEARSLARAVVADPHARLVPRGVDPDSTAGERVRFALDVRERLQRRKRELGVLDYDDLLTRLDAVLAAEDSPARVLMRRRWRVVLVDEFQDTDPVQWSIVERAFHGAATLVLIGDPKQAIYAFRGGDVVTYLRAAAVATARHTLPVNWRSDAPLVEALNATFAGAELGDAEIRVHPVRAHHRSGRLHDLPHPAPWRLRVVPRPADDPRTTLRVGSLRGRIAEDLAADVAELLASNATVDTAEARRPVVAGDVAVLVAYGFEADLVQRTLLRRGIPAVVGGGRNVLTSPAADDWLVLLEAIEAPHRSGLVRAAALTDLLGHDVDTLASGGDRLTDELATRVRDLGDLLAAGGIAAVTESLLDGGLASRLLARPDGPRRMTDLKHVAHLLHEVALRDGLGAAGLLQWLRRRRSDGVESPEAVRRLDSDAKAVQIFTVHASKGLEFPIVYLPFLFHRNPTSFEGRSDRRRDRLPRFHDDAGERLLDAGGPGHEEWRAHVARAQHEDAGEALRLTYVAMTRARSQLVAWWAPSAYAKHSGLHRLLFRPDPDSPHVPDEVAVPDEPTAAAVLRGWERRGGPTLELVGDRPPPRVSPETSGASLAIRTFDRRLDTEWRRTSYSALTHLDAEQSPVTSEPEETGAVDDEEESTAAVESWNADDRPSPMADLPRGAAFGSLVHAVLEEVDVRAPRLTDELRRLIDEQLRRWPVELDVDTAIEAFEAALTTPLGPLADDLDLRRLLAERQLAELDFEIPLGGGDRPRPTTARLGDLADLLDAHLAPDDPIRPFAARLRAPALRHQPLRGYLIGSIDLVLRLPSERFVVVDHKTNWLGPLDEPLTIAGYHPDSLAAAMNSSTYPLQALLYSAVVHRYLRWRLRGYDPERHLGGVLYLYLRGMVGPDTPRHAGVPYGVFSWRPPTSLVLALSDLLDGREVSR